MIKVYLALGALIVFLGLGGVALWYRGEAISATATAADARRQLATAVEANRQANATIDALQEQARLDNALTTSLLDKVGQINAGMVAQAAKLDDLRKSNAVIQSYLDATVPADLGELYGHH